MDLNEIEYEMDKYEVKHLEDLIQEKRKQGENVDHLVKLLEEEEETGNANPVSKRRKHQKLYYEGDYKRPVPQYIWDGKVSKYLSNTGQRVMYLSDWYYKWNTYKKNPQYDKKKFNYFRTGYMEQWSDETVNKHKEQMRKLEYLMEALKMCKGDMRLTTQQFDQVKALFELIDMNDLDSQLKAKQIVAMCCFHAKTLYNTYYDAYRFLLEDQKVTSVYYINFLHYLRKTTFDLFDEREDEAEWIHKRIDGKLDFTPEQIQAMVEIETVVVNTKGSIGRYKYKLEDNGLSYDDYVTFLHKLKREEADLQYIKFAKHNPELIVDIPTFDKERLDKMNTYVWNGRIVKFDSQKREYFDPYTGEVLLEDFIGDTGHLCRWETNNHSKYDKKTASNDIRYDKD